MHLLIFVKIQWVKNFLKLVIGIRKNVLKNKIIIYHSEFRVINEFNRIRN